MSEEQKNKQMPILVVPHSTPKRLLDLALKAGYIPIPAKSSDDVQLLVASNRYSGDDLLMSAMESLQGGCNTEARSRCVEALWKRIKDKAP